MSNSSPTLTGVKYVYHFGEGNARMKELLGGKGANLAEMTSIGIPVPFGFTISTEACQQFYKNNKQFPGGLDEEIDLKIAEVEKRMGAEFPACHVSTTSSMMVSDCGTIN